MLLDILAARQLHNRACIDAQPAPFIVGAPRSGTTLLRLMLDAHSQLAIPPETGFIVPIARMPLPAINAKVRFHRLVTQHRQSAQSWPDFGTHADEFWSDLSTIKSFDTSKGCRRFYEHYATRFGKTRWGDKTPGYCRHQRLIEKLLPEAHFIHIIRDGRDVALLLRKQWFAPGKDIASLAARWRDDVTIARQTRAPTDRRASGPISAGWRRDRNSRSAQGAAGTGHAHTGRVANLCLA
jgi:hypothetical protein